MTALALPTVSDTAPRANLGVAPPPMLHGADCVAMMPREWFVVYTQGHREKALAWSMLENDHKYYLPLQRIVKRVNGEKRTLDLPLFPNYAFGCGDATANFCRQSRHVITLVPIHAKEQALLIHDLSSLEIALFARPDLEVCDIDTVGQNVRVTGGAFEGAFGVVEEFLAAGKTCRVVIRINTLGRAVSFECDRSDLEAI